MIIGYHMTLREIFMMRKFDEIPLLPTLIVFGAIAFDLISFSVLTIGFLCVISERVF
jgi:hypothetical protein